METIKRKFYTAFVFGADGVADLRPGHCTHKYLGELGPREITNVRKLCQTFFSYHRKFPRACFEVEKIYGPVGEPVRVLTPAKVNERDWLPVLRDKLDLFRRDDYSYSPHITTGQAMIDRPFLGYALIDSQNNVVVQLWGNDDAA